MTEGSLVGIVSHNFSPCSGSGLGFIEVFPYHQRFLTLVLPAGYHECENLLSAKQFNCINRRPTRITFSFIFGLVTFASVEKKKFPLNSSWCPTFRSGLTRNSSKKFSGRRAATRIWRSEIWITSSPAIDSLIMEIRLMFSDSQRECRRAGQQRRTVCLNGVQGHGQVRQQVWVRHAHEDVRQTGCAKGERIFGREFLRYR